MNNYLDKHEDIYYFNPNSLWFVFKDYNNLNKFCSISSDDL